MNLKYPKPLPAFFAFLILLSPLTKAQQAEPFEHVSPESQGVSSAGIRDFLAAAAKSKVEFHSFVLLRHGKLISEGWWSPYSPDLKHTMYSVSKTFTATAVGFAISEHKLALQDKVVSFFPGQLPDTVSKNMSDMTVRDLLMMATGMAKEPTFPVVSTDTNWVKGFLGWTVDYAPGTHFLYNTLGTYMLSAIVQKVTGEKVIDYLRPRLFKPLGITDIDWEVSPQGVNTGGWGFRIKTEDMARFGQLFLQKGVWKGKQILPLNWVDSASTLKIIQHPDYPQAKRDSSDWEQGYCFQMWRCRHNAFRADGAFGQYIIMMPEQDAVLAITAESADMQSEIDLVWKYLLPAMKNGSLPADKSGDSRLTDSTTHLTVALPEKNALASGAAIAAAAAVSGKSYAMKTAGDGPDSISFIFEKEKLLFTETTGDKKSAIRFGTGAWERSVTGRPGPDLVSSGKKNFKTFNTFRIAGAYHWTDESNLVLTLRYIESPHTQTITCHFSGKNISVATQSSFASGKPLPAVEGTEIQ